MFWATQSIREVTVNKTDGNLDFRFTRDDGYQSEDTLQLNTWAGCCSSSWVGVPSHMAVSTLIGKTFVDMEYNEITRHTTDQNEKEDILFYDETSTMEFVFQVSDYRYWRSSEQKSNPTTFICTPINCEEQIYRPEYTNIFREEGLRIHIYKIHFTDGTIYPLMVMNISNGYYDGGLSHTYGKIPWHTGTVHIIAGLPGSGKSYYAQQLKADTPECVIYDDSCSNSLIPIIRQISGTSSYIFVDPRFIMPAWLNTVAAEMDFYGINDIHLHLFDNDPNQCIANISEKYKEAAYCGSMEGVSPSHPLSADNTLLRGWEGETPSIELRKIQNTIQRMSINYKPLTFKNKVHQLISTISYVTPAKCTEKIDSTIVTTIYRLNTNQFEPSHWEDPTIENPNLEDPSSSYMPKKTYKKALIGGGNP